MPRPRPCKSPRLRIEALEDRTVPTGFVLFSVDGDTLRLTGTGDETGIEITGTGAQGGVRVAGLGWGNGDLVYRDRATGEIVRRSDPMTYLLPQGAGYYTPDERAPRDFAGIRDVEVTFQQGGDRLIVADLDLAGDLTVRDGIAGVPVRTGVVLVTSHIGGGLSLGRGAGNQPNYDLAVYGSTVDGQTHMTDVRDATVTLDHSTFFDEVNLDTDDTGTTDIRFQDCYLRNVDVHIDVGRSDTSLVDSIFGTFDWDATLDADVTNRSNTFTALRTTFWGMELDTGGTTDRITLVDCHTNSDVEIDTGRGNDVVELARVVAVDAFPYHTLFEQDNTFLVDLDQDGRGTLRVQDCEFRIQFEADSGGTGTDQMIESGVNVYADPPSTEDFERLREDSQAVNTALVATTMNGLTAAGTIDQSGQLLVHGGEGASPDAVSLAVRGDDLQVRVTIGGQTFTRSFFAPALDAVRVQAGDGADQIDLDDLTRPVPVTIDAGGGRDTIRLAPASRRLAGLGGSPVTLVGGGEDDTLEVHDENAPAPAPYTVTGTAVTHPGVALTYESVEGLGLYMSQAKNVARVQGVEKATTLNVYGGGDGTTFVVGSPADGLGSLRGPAFLHGRAPNTTLAVDDRAGALGRTFTLADGLLSSTGAAFISHDGLAAVQVSAGPFADQFVVRRTAGGPAGRLDGGGGEDTLTGPDTIDNHAWRVTGAGAGTLDGLVTFAGMENLTGGAGNDDFAFRPGGSVAGRVDGGGSVGGNSLTYADLAAGVAVNLTAGTATGAAGGVRNIRNATGGSGSDLLVGDAEANVLVGNGGRDLLVGGANRPGAAGDLLLGDTFPFLTAANPDDDILVGGSTRYDAEAGTPTLGRALADWSGTAGYDARAAALLTGRLGVGDFTSNGRANTLTGGAGRDLYYGSQARDSHDRGATEVFVDPEALARGYTVDAGQMGTAAQPAWRFVRIDGVRYDGASPIPLARVPGDHTVADAGGAQVTYRVGYDGAVTYAPGLQGALAWDRTQDRLTVAGRPVTLDATVLGSGLYLDGAPVGGAQAPVTVRLLPGTHGLFAHNSNGNGYRFVVADGGAVTSTTAPAGVIDIDPANPARLVVRGRAVGLDVHNRADVAGLWIDGAPVSFQATRTRTVNLLPGTHTFFTENSDVFSFTVADSGLIAAIAAPAGIATGVGTRTLTLAAPALRVTVSATSLGHPSQPALRNFSVDGLSYNGSNLQTIPFVQGRHLLRTAGGNVAYFTVSPTGAVDYDPALEGALTGRGTTRLNVLGRVVRLNAAPLGLANLYVDGAPVSDARQELLVRLMPGSHSLFSHNTSGNVYGFTVDTAGAVTSTTAPAGVIDISVDRFGRYGLEVRGRAVQIDVSARPDVQTLWLDGVAYSFQAARAQTFNLLPGRHVLRMADGADRYFQVADDGAARFEADGGGIVLRRGA